MIDFISFLLKGELHFINHSIIKPESILIAVTNATDIFSLNREGLLILMLMPGRLHIKMEVDRLPVNDVIFDRNCIITRRNKTSHLYIVFRS